MKKISHKKTGWKSMKKLRTQVLLCCLLCAGNVVYADGASDNYVHVDGDKYDAGTSIQIMIDSPTKEIPASTDSIIGGLVSDDTPSNAIIAGQVSSGESSQNYILITKGNLKFVLGSDGKLDRVSTNNQVQIKDGSIHTVYASRSAITSSQNTVSMEGGTVSDLHVGSTQSSSGIASNNSAFIYGGTVTNFVVAGEAYNGGKAEGNTILIHGGTINGRSYGGFGGTAGADSSSNVENNGVSIINGIVNNDVYGGISVDNGNATNNSVFTYGGNVSGNIYGGSTEGSGNAEQNNSYIETPITGNVYGGYTKGNGNANSNQSVLVKGTMTSTNTDGSETTSTLTYNGEVTGNIYGGYAQGNGNVESNHSYIRGTVNGEVYGGYADGTGNVSSNVAMIYGENETTVTSDNSETTTNSYQANVTGNVYGGYATNSGNAEKNEAIISGGTISKNIYGGYTTGSGNANDNTVSIDTGYTLGYLSDGDIIKDLTRETINIGGDIYGGYAAGNGTANNNQVQIGGGVDLSKSNVYGGYSANGKTEGNMLAVWGAGNKVKSINNFQNIDFILSVATPDSSVLDGLSEEQKAATVKFYEEYSAANKIKKGETMLTAETANIQGAKITGYIDGDTDLTDGDTVTLIDAQTLNTDDNTTYEGTVAEGISFNHKLNVKRDGNKILATVGESSEDTSSGGGGGEDTSGGDEGGSTGGDTGGTTILEQTTIIPTPAVIAPKMLLNHIDNTMDWLPDEWGDGTASKELGSATQAEKPGYEIFGNFGTSSLRTNTGNGTHIDSKTNGMNLGFARRFDSENGARTYFAPLFDFGGGSYDSYLGNGIHGKGHTHFTTGGVIARRALTNGVYFESSLRFGKSTMDFATNDLVQGNINPHVAYDTSTNIWAAHLNFGRRLNLSPKDVLNVYGIYFHSHQGGMDAKLTTGETYRFNSVTNQRLRIGARLLKWAKPTSCFYSGVAYQWESAGAANATYKDQSTHNVGASGSSFMIELGWQVKPATTSRIALDIGAVGWLGHQRGGSAHVKFNYAF
ncbi:MAG: hypothetical protein IKN12_01740 [Selenomonadaceae bacterium]|nr:hypothetical protein [Selenomonadaceae bacterium]